MTDIKAFVRDREQGDEAFSPDNLHKAPFKKKKPPFERRAVAIKIV
jgi:hypothetical protein